MLLLKEKIGLWKPMMKISVFRFFGYIEYIEDILTDILKKINLVDLKLIKTYENIEKKI